MDRQISDDELLQKLQAGNHRYFSVFTDRYSKKILTKCLGYLKDPDSAADACQEILIKVFLQLPGFRHESKITTWLFTIIHHTCIDYLRRNKKNTHDIITDKLADEVADIVDHNEKLEEEKTVEVLEKLFEEITPQEKLLLLMKYKEKHHIKDIQSALGISESAVKMRLARAKERLNKLYAMKLKQTKNI